MTENGQSKVDEGTRKNLKQIIRIIEDSKSTYTKTYIDLALKREREAEIKPIYGTIIFLRGTYPDIDGHYDYGDLVVIRKTVDVNEAIRILEALGSNANLAINGISTSQFVFTMRNPHFVPSGEKYGVVGFDWPIRYSAILIRDGAGTPPRKLQSHLELPYYPDGIDAIIGLLQLNVDKYSRIEDIEILIPDFRARIKRIRIGGNRITIEVEAGTLTEDMLKVKMFVKGNKISENSSNLDVENGEAVFAASVEPIAVDAVVISSLDGETIDRRGFDFSRPYGKDDVVVEDFGHRIEQMIERGESSTIELKRSLDFSKTNEWLESIVSFANTRGGYMIVGVDDNCVVQGWSDADAEKTIVNRISDLCDPRIEVKVTVDVDVTGKPVTLVEIPEGANKPYMLKGKGIYIRMSSSDRQVTRAELDNFYESKKASGLVGWRGQY